MSRSEKNWVNLISFSLLAITTLPYMLGYWLQGESWRFTGFFLGVGDGNSYIAKMLSGSAGAWLFRTPYTSFPQNGFLAFFPYILLGKLVSEPGAHEQLVALFQIFRWAGGWLMVYGTYRFFAVFFEAVETRRMGTLLAVFGGGAGWLALLGLQGLWGSRIPLEFYSPETFGFLSFFTLPHLAAARGLLLLGLARYWESWARRPSQRQAWVSGALWLLLGLMQPLTALIGWGLIGLDLLMRFLRGGFTYPAARLKWIFAQVFPYLLIVAACSLPLILYSSISFLIDPFLKEWTLQNIIQSPPPPDYLMAYWIWIPLCLVAGWWGFRQKLERFFPLLAWIILIPVLAYFPAAIQRRLPEGSWAAIIAVGLVGLSILGPKIQKIVRVMLFTSYLATLILFLGSFLTLVQTKTPVYRPTEEVQVFEFLRHVANNRPIVLAGFDTSNAAPAWAPVNTLIGHGPESIHLAEVQARVEAFYRAEINPAEAAQFLQEFNVRYVIWGPEERALGSLIPAEVPGLKLDFQNTAYQVFEVTP